MYTQHNFIDRIDVLFIDDRYLSLDAGRAFKLHGNLCQLYSYILRAIRLSVY